MLKQWTFRTLGWGVLAFLFLSTGSAEAQEWNDGSPSRLQHQCWQGIFPSITEDLAWTYVGFKAPTGWVPTRMVCRGVEKSFTCESWWPGLVVPAPGLDLKSNCLRTPSFPSTRTTQSAVPL